MHRLRPKALCFTKLSWLIAAVIVSSCIRLAQQQHQSDLSNGNWLVPGQELIFVTTPAAKSVTSRDDVTSTTSSTTTSAATAATVTSKPVTDPVVFVNNQPVVPTMVPFILSPTNAPPDFFDCLSNCPTTSEFNPICASNREVYGNEQKFNCARQCGAVIEIVRRGSCEGLFPMSRG